MKHANSRNRKPGMSDEAVKAKTGKVWKEWFAILDKWGAKKKTHKEIATYLYSTQRVPGWWAQMVTVGYERVRGMREKHQTAQGYAASKSMVLSVPLGKLYAAWKDEAARRRWMRGGAIEVSSTTLNRSLRGSWNGGASRVDVMFFPKGKSKSQVAIDHQRLASRRDVDRLKAVWGANLERLQKHMGKPKT